MPEGTIVVVTEKEAVVRRVKRAADRLGHALIAHTSLEQIEPDPIPLAAIIDLDDAHGPDAPAVLRPHWPGVLLAGFMSVPDRQRWDAAHAAGYDLVTNRGAVATKLEEMLPGWTGPRRRERFRLMDAADTAGRLGCIKRVEDTPVGDVAVFHIGKQLFVVEDSCPHAGASLCGGELEEGIVTCPLHGSRFDVRSGARVRGPADRELATFTVVVEDGAVYMEIPQITEREA